jgi:hypothetical protein
MSRPSGIRLGGNVFQLPPPAVEAKVPESAGTGCAGTAGTGVAIGGASAISGAYGAVGVAIATEGFVAGGEGGGGGATATDGGDFSAMAGGAVAEDEGFGAPF